MEGTGAEKVWNAAMVMEGWIRVASKEVLQRLHASSRTDRALARSGRGRICRTAWVGKLSECEKDGQPY
jgi:hypothetical protein